MRYIFDDYILDTQRYELHRAGTRIHLRPKAFQVLAYLLAHRDRVVPKAELIEHVWPNQFIGDATLNSCIMAVRKALGDSGRTPRCLHTVHGQGYRFVAPVEERAPLPADTVPQATPSPAHALHPLASQEASAPMTWEVPQPIPDPVGDRVLGEGTAPVVSAIDGEHKQVTVLCGAMAEALARDASLEPETLHHLMQAVMALPEAALYTSLGRLQARECLYETRLVPTRAYTFKHALLQEVAYQSLLRSTRQQVHQGIAQVLMERFPEAAETQPELLAHHYTEAGLAAEAVAYWQRAGAHSTARSAYAEAAAHCTRGLEVLQTLPDTPTRAQQELPLLLTLAGALGVIKGFAAPEVGQVFSRARELCHHAGDTPELFDILLGLGGRYYQNRGELQTALALVEQALTLAQRLHDPVLLIRAHGQLGINLYNLGAPAPALTHLDQALTLPGSQPERSLIVIRSDPRLMPLACAAFTLWTLGYPDQALTRIHELLTLVQGLADPFSLARTLHYATSLHLMRREWAIAQARAEAGLALSTERGFEQWVGGLTIQRGQVLAAQGQYEEGIAQMRLGLAAKQAAGAEMGRPGDLAHIAEAYGRSGQAEAGMRLLDEARAWMVKHGEDGTAAAVYRIQGEVLLRHVVPDVTQAAACFQQALDVARRQQARSLELRAAMSLSCLWQRQGKSTKARELLAPLYGWFTEGFDTPDLQDARALLEALA